MIELAFASGAEGAGAVAGGILLAAFLLAIITGGGKSKRKAPPQVVPESGWYADPQRKARLRYWDGARWTNHTAD